MNRPLILTDLDDTLFLTARKIDVPLDRCTVASTLVDGSPSGYRTPALRALWDLMLRGDVVPVTARGRDVMARCDVPQAPAICSNGGVVVTAEGAVDPEWHETIVREAAASVGVAEIHDKVAEMAGDGFRHWTVDEAETPLYACFKSNASDHGAIERLALDVEDGDALPDGWRVHRNGNNLAILPPWISKRRAARHVIERAREADPDRLVIGVGDSVSDLGFMAECDYAMHPVDSQIGRLVASAHSW